jgi:UDP-N-acetylmuramoyl-tripeptide--D-alanyl-D-alanine ligase
MMELVLILSIIWGIRIVLNLSSFIHLWYIKEYRFDRMVIHLQTKQGKRLLFLPFRRPPLSPKSIVIFIISLLTILVLFYLLPFHTFIKLAILDISLFPITLVFVLLVKIPTVLYHQYLIKKSVQLLRQHKKMIVIGITGSYGKTSTKEILYTLLSQKYNTLKTEASKNSPIAIAELLLHSLKPEHEIFIVEMGAYKKGEIAEMCSMVKPDIGIVTAINAQHQDLFGSIENTIEAKYELISGLTGKRIAICNADNAFVKKMGEKAEKEGCDVKYYKNAMARDVEETLNGLKFTVELQKKRANFEVPVLGVHQVSNILASIVAAHCCGMTSGEITKASLDIQPFPKTMQPIQGIHDAIFIDDTFNNNPDAAKAAIDYLATKKSKKILVFQPMIELGAYADESHRMVGAYAAKVCDEIFLTNDNYSESFIEGVESVVSENKVHIMEAKDAAAYLRKIVKKGDTVLFKGKESARVLHLLV